MGNRRTKLDLTRDENIERFFADFGGTAAAKEKYPLVYDAVMKTNREGYPAKNNICQDENKDDAEDKGFIIGAIHAVASDKSVARTADNNAKEATEDMLACNSGGTVKDAVMIGTTMELIDLTTSSMIDSSSSYIEGTDIESEVASKISEIGLYNDHEIEANCKFYYINPDGTCGQSEMKTANFVLHNGSSLVTEFVVDNPKIASDHTSNKHVTIVYDRTPKNSEQADYSYNKDEIELQGNLVKTIIPVSGHFKLNKNMEPKGLSSIVGLQLVYDEEVVVSYLYTNIGELDNYFTKEKDENGIYTVSFDFDKDWHAYLNKKRYNDGTYITDCQLRWSFRYDCYLLSDGNRVKDDKGNEVIMELGLCINSERSKPSDGEYNKSSGNKVVIPYLFIQWGCFGKNTDIMMADGSVKKVCDISPKEYVMDAFGNPALVREVYTGMEESLLRIVTESGRTLELTDGHPVLTDNGMVRACRLVPDAVIHTVDGAEKIEAIQRVPYNDTVYSLDCDGALLRANDLIAGDFVSQNSQEKKKKPAVIDSDLRALMEEMKRMLDDFGKNGQ